MYIEVVMKWRATFDVWPFYGMEVKNKEESFEFEADRIDHALKTANLIKAGIQTNQNVWQCILRELVGKHS